MTQSSNVERHLDVTAGSWLSGRRIDVQHWSWTRYRRDVSLSYVQCLVGAVCTALRERQAAGT